MCLDSEYCSRTAFCQPYSASTGTPQFLCSPTCSNLLGQFHRLYFIPFLVFPLSHFFTLLFLLLYYFSVS